MQPNKKIKFEDKLNYSTVEKIANMADTFERKDLKMIIGALVDAYESMMSHIARNFSPAVCIFLFGSMESDLNGFFGRRFVHYVNEGLEAEEALTKTAIEFKEKCEEKGIKPSS